MKINEMTIGNDYKLKLSAAPQGANATSLKEAKLTSIMDDTVANGLTDTTVLLRTSLNQSNSAVLNGINPKDRLYFLFSLPTGENLIVPDYTIVEGSIEQIAFRPWGLTITVKSETDKDTVKAFLRSAGLSYKESV
jgi:hypothetical protein